MNRNLPSQSVFRDHAEACIRKAETIYGISLGRVTITFDLKGRSAAKAYSVPHRTLGKTYKLRFNKSALAYDWQSMVESTIPHEVAHLVAFAKPEIGAEGHNWKWRAIAINLGDTKRGQVYHTMPLPPARQTRKYRYRNDKGDITEVGIRLHAKVQAGTHRIVGAKKEQFFAHHYEGLA